MAREFLKSGYNVTVSGRNEQSFETAKKDKYEVIQTLNDVGYHPRALRRVYIDKPSKNEKRLLSISTMKDRTMQALYLQTLAPIAETQADKTSFGF